MKVVVIGGTGLIGSKLVSILNKAGHEALPASPQSGVNTLTGEGLAGALAGADTVVDVVNAPALDPQTAVVFFITSGLNVLKAAKAAGVRHHITLSIVGVGEAGLNGIGYMRAKLAQEALAEVSGLPWTIVQATQFFELLQTIGESGASGNRLLVSTAPLQPLAAADVADLLAELATGTPRNARVVIAGAEKSTIADFVARRFSALDDPREVVPDPAATYFGTDVSSGVLTPSGDHRTGPTSFTDWLASQ